MLPPSLVNGRSANTIEVESTSTFAPNALVTLELPSNPLPCAKDIEMSAPYDEERGAALKFAPRL